MCFSMRQEKLHLLKWSHWCCFLMFNSSISTVAFFVILRLRCFFFWWSQIGKLIHSHHVHMLLAASHGCAELIWNGGQRARPADCSGAASAARADIVQASGLAESLCHADVHGWMIHSVYFCFHSSCLFICLFICYLFLLFVSFILF